MDIAFKIQKETWPDDPDYEDLYDKAINKEDNNCFFLVYDKNVLVGITGVDVYDKYPEACNLNKNGKPEMWNINILFPAALKLIQDQHKELQTLKRKIKVLNKKCRVQQKEIEELKAIKSQFHG